MEQDMSGEKRCVYPKRGDLVTLINVSETKPEQQTLIEQWTHFTEEIKKGPGVIGIALHPHDQRCAVEIPGGL
jgi:hypothetical protein